MNTRENVKIMVDAIVEDARIYLEVAGPEDFGENDQHKRCLELIGRTFDAQAEVKDALEEIARHEDAIRNDVRLAWREDDWTASPLTIAMAFFEAAGEADEEARTALFRMMRHIADFFEAKEALECR